MPMASSLDQAGPIARTVRDAALMLSIMSSFDEKDSTSVKAERPDYLSNLVPSVKGLKIGLIRECFQDLSNDLSKVMQANVEKLKSLGAEVVEVSLGTLKYALPAYYITQPAEVSSNLAKYDGVHFGFRAPSPATLSDLYAETRRAGFGKEVRRRIFIGTYVLSRDEYESYYLLAKKVILKMQNDFKKAFESVDVLLTPTTTGGAFGIEEGPKMSPIEMYLNDVFTITVNLAKLPGISVPGGETSDGLPLGIQFIGPQFSEQLLFNVAAAVEETNANNTNRIL
jgi:aspartyl-tRNA(Asn)/glutamyl-tRNA(Gln) amidotransferase subunit A